MTHFCLDILLRTVHAKGMHVFAVAGYHSVEWAVCEAALALAHLVVHLRLLQIDLLCSLCLFNLGTFACVFLDFLFCCAKLFRKLAFTRHQCKLDVALVAGSNCHDKFAH